MSEKFMIDEQHIKMVAESHMRRIESIVGSIKEMINTDKDPFDRYMSFNKLKAVFCIMDAIIPIYKQAMCVGHAISHPFLQTDRAKECHWDSVEIEREEFFCQVTPSKSEKTRGAESTSAEFKKFLADLLKSLDK
jgi:hypothetical protein